jgi:hypothetical protein
MATADKLAMSEKMQGGYDFAQAEACRKRLKWLEEQCLLYKRDADKHRSLADLAGLQVQGMERTQGRHKDEVEELKAHCTSLETKSDEASSPPSFLPSFLPSSPRSFL